MKSLPAAMAILTVLAAPSAFAATAAIGFKAATPPPCAAPLSATGQRHTFAPPFDEGTRQSLSLSVAHALQGAPNPLTRPSAACAVASFKADDASWTIHAGQDKAPSRWIVAAGRDEWFYLTKTPPLAASTRPPTYFVVGVFDDYQVALAAYDAAPTDEAIAEDIAKLIGGDAAPLASFYPDGDVVTVNFSTVSGVRAEVYTPSEIDADHPAYLAGADGKNFVAEGATELVVLRGSGLRCPEQLGAFERTNLAILNPSDAQLDLACVYGTDDSQFTVYASRLTDLTSDARRFEAALTAYERATGVSERIIDPPTGPDFMLQAGRNWIDKSGLVQMVLFMRRGEYVLQLRATHTVKDTNALNEAILPVLDQVSPGRR